MATCNGFPLFYCQKVLPAAFDDSLSYYEQICKLTEKVNEIINKDESDLEQIQQAIKELYDYVHGTAWEDAIREWVLCNLPCLIATVCKFFVFSVNDDGYVVVSVPLSWQQANLHWILDYDSDNFGHFAIGW